MRTKKPSIKYTNREFDTIKQDLVNYAKTYYPDTFKDFQESGFGSLMLDTIAYVGDQLSFYADYAANESFIETATDFQNVNKLSKALGFKYNPNKTSTGIVTLYLRVPATTDLSLSAGVSPNLQYAGTLKKGTTFSTRSGTMFLLAKDVNFADPNNEVVVAAVNSNTGQPTSYAIRSFGRVISGRIARTTANVGEYKPFRRVQIRSNNVVEVLSVFDSEGREYFEVDYLSQDVVYKEIPNSNGDRQYVSSIMKPVAAPRRFEVIREDGYTYLQFGYGSEADLDEYNNFVDSNRKLVNVFGKEYVSDLNFDPNILLKTGKLGVSPSNTTLYIVYRTNIEGNVNIPSQSINRITKPILFFENKNQLNVSQIQSTIASLEVENESPIVGDISIPNAEELRQRAIYNYASQNRAVTSQDYKSLVYNMPPQFGSVKRVSVYRDENSVKNNINMYVVSEDSKGALVEPTTSLRNNIKTFIRKYKPVGDVVDVLNAKILGIKIEYEVISDIGVEPLRVQSRINEKIREMTRTKPEIGEAIRVADMISAINEINGVSDVVRFKIRRKFGSGYSTAAYNLDKNTSPDGRYIFIPKNAIWELKSVSSDVEGIVR